jgi:phosphocarrier protein HPr
VTDFKDRASDLVEEKDIRIENRLGFHARPAAMFVKAASKYDCEIAVAKGGNSVSGKSLMGILSLEAEYGSTITVTAKGAEAKEALDEIEALLKSKFNHYEDNI